MGAKPASKTQVGAGIRGACLRVPGMGPKSEIAAKTGRAEGLAEAKKHKKRIPQVQPRCIDTLSLWPS